MSFPTLVFHLPGLRFIQLEDPMPRVVEAHEEDQDEEILVDIDVEAEQAPAQKMSPPQNVVVRTPNRVEIYRHLTIFGSSDPTAKPCLLLPIGNLQYPTASYREVWGLEVHRMLAKEVCLFVKVEIEMTREMLRDAGTAYTPDVPRRAKEDIMRQLHADMETDFAKYRNFPSRRAGNVRCEIEVKHVRDDGTEV